MNKILVKLTRNKVSIIDKEDKELVTNYNWYCLRTGYAATSVGGSKNKKMIYLHRLIMNVTNSKISVDHINKNKLDNRKENLRICTHQQNCRNSSKSSFKKTSKFKGVYLDKVRNKWVSKIKVNYKDIFLGRFELEVDAALAYNKAAKKYFGKFASLNTL